ncbi:MAG: hypothetical protein HRU09_10585 [Oligoflexales bacterium]|nr:hypothetical protein [Oligoflexales bacterium]
MRIYWILMSLTTVISTQNAFAEKKVSLNGDHFFIAANADQSDYDLLNANHVDLEDDYVHMRYDDEMIGLSSIELESHSKTPSLCNFYINHKRNLKCCFKAHTERRTRHSGGSTYSYTVTVCDEYDTILSDYQSKLQLQIKGQGAKKTRNIQLSFEQREAGGYLYHQFSDLKSSHKGKKEKGLTTFNYKGWSKPFNKVKNKLGLWKPEKLLSVEYKQDVEVLVEKEKNSFLIEQRKVEPIVKEISLVLLNGKISNSDSDHKYLDIEYFVPKKHCFQSVDVIVDRNVRSKCIAYGVLPQKEKLQLEMKGGSQTQIQDRVIKIYAVQKYLSEEPKLVLGGDVDYKGVSLLKQKDAYILQL